MLVPTHICTAWHNKTSCYTVAYTANTSGHTRPERVLVNYRPLRGAMWTHKALGLSSPIAETNYGV
jgi:hypothetical protein